mgnify:FL=1
MPVPIANAANAPVRLWDRAPWDIIEGEDFEDGEWRILACEMKAIAEMIGGYGSAAEIIHRNRDLSIKNTIFRWQYIATRKQSWTGGL